MLPKCCALNQIRNCTEITSLKTLCCVRGKFFGVYVLDSPFLTGDFLDDSKDLALRGVEGGYIDVFVRGFGGV